MAAGTEHRGSGRARRGGTPEATTYLVRVISDAGAGKARIHYVGPFTDSEQARRYAERIERSSNGNVRGQVAPMTAP